MGIRVKDGDVFLVPLDGTSWALGQVLSDYEGELYVAIFCQKIESTKLDPRDVIGLRPIFLALTLDAKLFHGDWPLLGNVQENLSSFPQPTFKVRQSGVVRIESRDRTLSRMATPAEAEKLRYRSVASPAMIEGAVKAHFFAGEWNHHYKDFDASYAFESSRLMAT